MKTLVERLAERSHRSGDCLLWFLGTHGENMADMKAKGRGRWSGIIRRGERHPGSILNAEQVQEIRRIYLEENFTQDQIGAMYSVTGSAVAQIISGAKWGSLPGALSAEERKICERRSKAASRRRSVEVQFS